MLTSSARNLLRSVAPQAARRTFATEIYHAGLKKTEFTNSMEYTKESQVIPIFRVMNTDGEIDPKWGNPFTNQELIDKYKFMVTLSVWDEMMYNIQRQGRISFYIQNMGEEAAQTGIASALTVEDPIWSQYRELGVLMYRGFSLEDCLDQLFSTEGDEGKGRQMPISYTKKSINLPSIATPLATQIPHAAGAGYSHKIAGEKRVSVGFFGDGSASEGDVHAALNFASVLKSQTIFICRNNGYAISTPVKDQYAGDGIAIRGLAYGMETIRVDGNDLIACYLATKKAREICVERSEPVLIEFMTYRMGHHSTSDDSGQYRPAGEFDAWNRPGVNPITRVRRHLDANNLWSQAEEDELRRSSKATMLTAMKVAEKKLRFPIIPGIFDDVYAESTIELREQAESLKEHLRVHADKYDFTKYRN